MKNFNLLLLGAVGAALRTSSEPSTSQLGTSLLGGAIVLSVQAMGAT